MNAMELMAKLINKLTSDLLDGYSNYGTEEANKYVRAVLLACGLRTTLEIHKKSRNLYYRFLVLEQFKEKDDDYLNLKTTEFLNSWNEVQERKDTNRAIDDLCNIKDHKQLVLLIKTIIETVKAELLVAKALEIKQTRK